MKLNQEDLDTLAVSPMSIHMEKVLRGSRTNGGTGKTKKVSHAIVNLDEGTLAYFVKKREGRYTANTVDARADSQERIVLKRDFVSRRIAEQVAQEAAAALQEYALPEFGYALTFTAENVSSPRVPTTRCPFVRVTGEAKNVGYFHVCLQRDGGIEEVLNTYKPTPTPTKSPEVTSSKP